MMISTTGQTRISRRRHTFLRFTQRFFVIAGTLALSYVAVTLLYARIYQKVANNTLEQQMHAQELHTVSQTLRLGVGHIGGTALPGEPGNIGIAGHRDTYFRALKDIRPDDEIQIQTATGVARYAVDWIQITAPGDSDILPHKSGSALTLVTCYPFYFVGSAPERYVVHAHTK